mmetsp:Transcript_64248/g.114095  ORF Transcript_64248/g.114095 Transcript_64248/m.114095 type:complete len:222 (+) Transcript_64248:129-794(+)
MSMGVRGPITRPIAPLGGVRAVSPRGSRPSARSPSPTPGLRNNDLDPKSIIAHCQATTEDLDVKMREKIALSKLLAELKKKKMMYDAKGEKKKREVDSTVVQTIEMEKKLAALNNGNKTMGAELAGLRAENEKMEAEVEALRRDFKEASENYEKEVSEIEKMRRTLYSYRKEVNAEAKQRDNVQQDLRASRTAQSLMINRLDNMEKRNRALKTCLVNAFNH